MAVPLFSSLISFRGEAMSSFIPKDSQLLLMMAIMLVGVLVTWLVLVGVISVDVPEGAAENWGQTISMLLLFTGFAAHMAAKKGPVPIFLLLLPAVFGPLYALIGGRGSYLWGYHLIAVGIYGFVFWNEKIRRKKAAEAQDAE